MKTKTWHVEVYLDEDDARTSAQAVLSTGLATHLVARGTARLAPDDIDVPEIGDEVAAARALHVLADQLLCAAAGDIGAIEGAPVALTFEEPRP